MNGQNIQTYSGREFIEHTQSSAWKETHSTRHLFLKEPELPNQGPQLLP